MAEKPMFKIGPHCTHGDTPDLRRADARVQGWGAFQTFPHGNRSSLSLNPNHVSGIRSDKSTDLIWVTHSSYPALFNPPDRARTATFRYFTNLAEWMRRVGSQYSVIHLGATKDQDPDQTVQRAIDNWQEQTLLRQFCTNHGIKFLVENVAAKYPVNQDLHHTARIANSDPTLGWCLDLAHANAAGVPYLEVLKIIVNPETRPTILHANYPGSAFGSGKDRHGLLCSDDTPITEEQKVDWKTIVKVAYAADIPLILEHPQEPVGLSEVQAYRDLVMEHPWVKEKMIGSQSSNDSVDLGVGSTSKD